MNETAVVAGVGPTIGASVVRRFHSAGFDVGLLARSTEFVAELADDLVEGALAVQTDVTDQAAVEVATETVRERFSPISCWC